MLRAWTRSKKGRTDPGVCQSRETYLEVMERHMIRQNWIQRFSVRQRSERLSADRRFRRAGDAQIGELRKRRQPPCGIGSIIDTKPPAQYGNEIVRTFWNEGRLRDANSDIKDPWLIKNSVALDWLKHPMSVLKRNMSIRISGRRGQEARTAL
jgi:hypothetical protein